VIIVCDAPNWFHALWHSAGAGKSTEQFLRRVKAIKDTWHPERIICAFDSPDSFRRDLEPTYKAGRKHDAELVSELRALPQDLLNLTTASVALAPGFEADDILATIAHEARQSQRQCVLCTSDKDVRQALFHGFVTIARKFSIEYGKVVPEWLTAANHEEQTGVPVGAWIDWQCLVGDSTDNITGAKGIGEKTATAMIQQMGTLEAILADPWRVKCSDKQRASLFAFRERAPLVRKLVTCRVDVPEVWQSCDFAPACATDCVGVAP
jgi:DNA polymerase-1